MTPEITIRWMSFEEYGDEIIRLRRKVYREEQGFGDDVVYRPRDAEGLHLGVLKGSELVAVVSAFVIEDDPAFLAERRLPPTSQRVVEFGSRMTASEFRGLHWNQTMLAMFGRSVYETLRPEYIFFTLRGVHRSLQSYYSKLFAFKVHATLDDQEGAIIMTAPDEPSMREMYLRARNLSEDAIERDGIHVPSLVRFLERTGRVHLLALEKTKRDNLYVAPLSLKDEFPRLSAQTRLVHREQKAPLSATRFPPPPARLLDLGAGPGVYLSMLSGESKLRGYELVGLDEMPDMVTYARLNRPDIRWIRANAYDTGEPDQSYDVVHVNFLFIHLVNPAAVLREVHRILKPGGLFYIVETNDSTFEGPPTIAQLIRSHCELYLGNRRIMNSLPHMAGEHGFELTQRFSTKVRNTGAQSDPVFSGDTMLVNRMTMWGLYSFLGQREELAEQLNEAQQVYFNSTCEISVCVETHVYTKVA